jgi:uncharacterized protein (DUF433 family)
MMPAFSLDPIAVPLREDETGAIRVGRSRVHLELVIHAFRAGATPEAIVQSYETLALADVYAVISHYLAHPDSIDEYLGRREIEAETTRQKIETSLRSEANLRQVLLARQIGQKV